MKVYVVANEKGGVGKTTTALALASILREKGYKTLLIDTDLQLNSTKGYKAQVENTETLWDVLLAEERVPIEQAIQKCERGDIIASDKLLKRADDILKNDLEGYFRLQESLKGLKGYDYVIIDTPPRVDSISYNCFACADEVIIPINCDIFSVEGLASFSNTLEAVKKRLNPNIKVAGILRIRTKRNTNLYKDLTKTLETYSEQTGMRLFKSDIRVCEDINKAHKKRVDITNFSKNCNGSKDYRAFVEELLAKEE